jgi:hypothetical protein
MLGNKIFNQIFEANLEKNFKPKITNTEARQNFIKTKYERHFFVKSQFSVEDLAGFVDFCKKNTQYKIFEYLIKLFAEVDLMTPVVNEPLERNVLQLVLIHLDETNFFYITYFIVQNRDFPKNKYSINYQDSDGNTALHYSVIFSRIESVKILLRANINIKLKNKNGLTAWDIATQLNNTDCLKQINLFLEGKAIGKIEWFFTLDEDYMSDGMEIEDIDFGESVANNNYALHSRNPSLLISVSNKSEMSNLKAKHYRYPSEPSSCHAAKNKVVENIPIPFSQNQDNRKSLDKTYSMPSYEKNVTSVIVSNSNNSNLGHKLALINNPNFEPNKLPYELRVNSKRTIGPKYKTVRSYSPNENNHLSFKQNEVIIVTNKSDSKLLWYGYLENCPDKKGFFPANSVNIYV